MDTGGGAAYAARGIGPANYKRYRKGENMMTYKMRMEELVAEAEGTGLTTLSPLTHELVAVASSLLAQGLEAAQAGADSVLVAPALPLLPADIGRYQPRLGLGLTGKTAELVGELTFIHAVPATDARDLFFRGLGAKLGAGNGLTTRDSMVLCGHLADFLDARARDPSGGEALAYLVAFSLIPCFLSRATKANPAAGGRPVGSLALGVLAALSSEPPQGAAFPDDEALLSLFFLLQFLASLALHYRRWGDHFADRDKATKAEESDVLARIADRERLEQPIDFKPYKDFRDAYARVARVLAPALFAHASDGMDSDLLIRVDTLKATRPAEADEFGEVAKALSAIPYSGDAGALIATTPAHSLWRSMRVFRHAELVAAYVREVFLLVIAKPSEPSYAGRVFATLAVFVCILQRGLEAQDLYPTFDLDETACRADSLAFNAPNDALKRASSPAGTNFDPLSDDDDIFG